MPVVPTSTIPLYEILTNATSAGLKTAVNAFLGTLDNTTGWQIISSSTFYDADASLYVWSCTYMGPSA